MLAAILLLALAAMVYLVFFFPRMAALWSATGEPLSMAERIVYNTSLFCRSFALILLPLLMGGLIGCILWVILAERHQSRKPRGSHRFKVTK
jgi:type II secretory pathway component PulF